MDRARATQIIEAYGADAAHWPAPERAAAQALLAGDSTLQALAGDAARLDALLDAAAAPARPSDLLRIRVLRAAPRLLGWRAALPLAASLLLGISAGLSLFENGESAALAADTVRALTFAELALEDAP